MSVILGINAFHADSAACVLLNGRLVAAIAEERLGERLKHSPKFPVNSIRWVLQAAGMRLRDVTHVALPRDSKANRSAKIQHVLRHPLSGIRAGLEHFSRQRRTEDIVRRLSEILDEDPSLVKFKVCYVEHHLAHIASSYYASPFESATAGFSFDASGDFTSAMMARCEGGKIQVVDRVLLPDSLGFFYTAMCQFIGFDGFGEEYKVMGLAPYGDDSYGGFMSEAVSATSSGGFRLNRKLFGMHGGGQSGALSQSGGLEMGRFYTDALCRLLGAPRSREEPITQREKDIARSTQVRFEQLAVHCVDSLTRRLGTRQIAMAGGCALNGVANARMLRETEIERQYIQPAASDDGTCLGAALYAYHNHCGGSERIHLRHAFWGGEYTVAEMRKALEAAKPGSEIKECANDGQLVTEVARLISSGHVVGWFQGRSEWGPRALGNRSILANPADPEVKSNINKKIKRRESFRPFAPSVIDSKCHLYFDQPVNSPFMMHVVRLKREWRERLPGITHVDGTGRVQTVDREANPLYHDLILALGQITGVYMVLNTSFNENEPVVERPEQAVSCYLRTDMDALVLGRIVVCKKSKADR